MTKNHSKLMPLLVLFGALQFAPATPLNDDGITTFSNGTQNGLTTEPADFPGQSATYGRDAAFRAGKLTKIGGGRAGFDFTKIANDGSELPVSAVLGSGAKDWACTRDNVTGLIWEIKTTDGGLRDSSWTYTWYSSDTNTNGGSKGAVSGGNCKTTGRCDIEKYTADVNAVGLCGNKDWRVPSVGELHGIVDYGFYHPAIDTAFFPKTPSSFFWSSSPYAMGSGYSWPVDSDYGYNGYSGRGNNYQVRLVRGGQSFGSLEKATGANCNAKIRANTPSSDFIDNGDGTVLHKSTGLIWKRCAEGQSWDGSTCTGSGRSLAWGEALDSAQKAVFAGATDWRLPNIKELASIVEIACSSPSINTSIFPNTPSLDFWSSSPTAHGSSYSLYVFFRFGTVYDYKRANTILIRLVRGGQSFGSFDLRTGTVPVLHPHPELRKFSGQTRILSATGRLIWEGQVSEGDLGRMMGGYARGTYFVEGNMGTQRVVNP